VNGGDYNIVLLHGGRLASKLMSLDPLSIDVILIHKRPALRW
jgi:hypothetical protein